MDSEEDYYYSSGNEETEDDGGGSGDYEAAEDDDGAAVSHLKKNYTILKQDDIKKLHENDISTVCNVLSVSRGVACHLLCRNNWNLNSAYNEWFSNEEKTHETLATLGKRKLGQEMCTICYECYVSENMLSVTCGHPFCRDCWRTYISTSINDGVLCLTLRCPEPSCKTPAGLDMAELLATDDEKAKFYKYLMESYIEGNRDKKWCPGPGCDFAVQLDESDSNTNDVVCDCKYKFCWNCMEESHRPTDCETVEKWMKRHVSDDESTTWIIAYTKPCPKCHKSIEKNQGCNHMTCKCGHQFCWVCLVSWNRHNDYYRCNQFKSGNAEVSNDEKLRLNARLMLERYAHYYERWVSNDKSMKVALADLSRARAEQVEVIARVQEEPEAQLTFVTDAWAQIAECRRVLKWSYAYGYYMDNEDEVKVKFFEYLQGRAESALEKLHHCAEKEMRDYLVAKCDCSKFWDFRSKLAGLTGVTRNYFENLVRALENNLSEVEGSSNKSKLSLEN